MWGHAIFSPSRSFAKSTFGGFVFKGKEAKLLQGKQIEQAELQISVIGNEIEGYSGTE